MSPLYSETCLLRHHYRLRIAKQFLNKSRQCFYKLVFKIYFINKSYTNILSFVWQLYLYVYKYTSMYKNMSML